MKNKINWTENIGTQRRYIRAIKNFESFNIFKVKNKIVKNQRKQNNEKSNKNKK